MLDVLHELIDAVAGLRGISGNKQAELHARLDRGDRGPPKRGYPRCPRLMSLLELGPG